MAGTLTFSDIKDEVVRALGNRTDFDSARLLRIINLAQMRIARVARWEELEHLFERSTDITSSAEADRFIPIPTLVRDVYSLMLIDGAYSRKLRRLSVNSIDRKVPMPDYYARRRPRSYILWRENFEVFPVPDAVYLLRARAIVWPTKFSGADGQVSDLDQKDDMIVALSISWAFQTLKMFDESSKWWTVYKSLLSDALVEESENPDLLLLPSEAMQQSGTPGDYIRDPFVRTVNYED